MQTVIQYLGTEQGCPLYMKREDLIPYSFGGNKARKALLFFEEIDRGDYDTVVTYGSSHSNHCRVVANMAAARGMQCMIIGSQEVCDETYNSRMMALFGAEIRTVPVQEVHDTIEQTLADLRAAGRKPYFIEGGGHGNIGTEAYVQCYREIAEYERSTGEHFDLIFFASGTGTTHAGLVCGQMIGGDAPRLIGISIARKNPRGRNVVRESIDSYFAANGFSFSDAEIEKSLCFLDDYICAGYGTEDDAVSSVIRYVMKQYGIPLDSTYTGKAFRGMLSYLEENGIHGQKILFIHTGGTPLFFDDLNKI